ncbi:MAG: FAD-dependent oxidoreductase [Alphaproteobacteria bacterium]|nr:FAD-dependent oxidoreductase [Alphaproteobacteria bacterium]
MDGGDPVRDVTVIGAGTVGVCTALWLQRDGHRVTLVDRCGPGEATSFGNAGLIQTGAVVPIATPGVLRQVPRMLTDPKGPLVIRWQYLPRLAPWLLRFIAAARPDRVEEISIALAALLGEAKDGYRPLIEAAAAEDLVRPLGELYVYRRESSYLAHAPYHALRRRRGINVVDLGPDELRQVEPALGPGFHRGVLLPDSLGTANPYRLTSQLARHFVANGGAIRRETVTDIEVGPDGPRALVTESGRSPVDHLVVAAGAWSKPLARRLGHPVPLETERGYHMMLPDPGVSLRVALLSGDHRFAITPMVDGVRLAGTAELASLDAAPNYARAEMLVPMAQAIVPALNTAGGVRWMGHRPSVPDSLPVIGRSSLHARVFFAFGHGHLGLTLAGITGRLVADALAGRTPRVDLAPFRIERFAGR